MKINQELKKARRLKLLKYFSWNFLIILLAGSLISNIIFIPKYYQNLNYQTTKMVKLDVIGQSDQYQSPLLWSVEIITTKVSLGDLLAQFPANFVIKGKSNIGMGRFLTAFNYTDQTGNLINLAANSDYFWQILIGYKPAIVGVDSIELANNTNYQLLYKKL